MLPTQASEDSCRVPAAMLSPECSGCHSSSPARVSSRGWLARSTWARFHPFNCRHTVITVVIAPITVLPGTVLPVLPACHCCSSTPQVPFTDGRAAFARGYQSRGPWVMARAVVAGESCARHSSCLQWLLLAE
jgi:hypothetical protein